MFLENSQKNLVLQKEGENHSHTKCHSYMDFFVK